MKILLIQHSQSNNYDNSHKFIHKLMKLKIQRVPQNIEIQKKTDFETLLRIGQLTFQVKLYITHRHINRVLGFIARNFKSKNKEMILHYTKLLHVHILNKQ